MKYLFSVLFLFIGIAHGQLVDKNDPGYIQVMGVGKTAEEAKQNGFKNAISMKVGSALLSENQVANNKLLKEELIDYSAGYIDSYTIIDTIVKPGNVVVIMQVVVRSSKIHERILSKGKDEKELDGSKFANQYFTYLNQGKDGDRVLNAVLNDYPKRAFNITQSLHEFKLNSSRNAVLVVPFELRWSKPFLGSLHEVVKLLADGSYRSSNRVVIGHSKYNFNDQNRYEHVRQHLSSVLQLRANMIDNSNRTIISQCYMIPSYFSGTYSSGIYVVYENEVLKNTIQIEIDPIRARDLEKVSRIELSVVSECSN
jgi:hypothetical protein